MMVVGLVFPWRRLPTAARRRGVARVGRLRGVRAERPLRGRGGGGVVVEV